MHARYLAAEEAVRCCNNEELLRYRAEYVVYDAVTKELNTLMEGITWRDFDRDPPAEPPIPMAPERSRPRFRSGG